MVHRPSTLKSGRQGSEALGLFLLLALILLEAAWFTWFVLEPLPSVGSMAGGKGLARVNLLVRAVPEVVPGLRFRESYLGAALEKLSHVENLPQRLPILLASGLVVLSSITLGFLVLRLLRLRDRLESIERIVLGFGLGTTGLGLAILIVGRLGGLHPWAIRLGLAIPIVIEGLMAFLDLRRGRMRPGGGSWPGRGSILGFAALTGPFLLIMMLGSMLPTIEFDALEYHLQGPKEYYQSGRIAYLPHNVYTSMPFGVEMLHLIGMEILDDWWYGALVGQVLVAAFAPMTALLIGLTARRLGSPKAGWIAAVVYLTTPWVYRMAVLPYVEGPLCYFHAALIWVWVRTGSIPVEGTANSKIDATTVGPLVGLLAGGAMALKYPALISAVIPASAWAFWTAYRQKSWKLALGFSIGFVLVMAPWLGKNVLDTGNPVYPLGFSVFGGRDWNLDRQAQWSAAHGMKPIGGRALIRSFFDVAGRSDWQSPLYAALVPFAFFPKRMRKASIGIGVYSAYLFLTWWFLTHRLDRFWLPILPSLAVLAGLCAEWSIRKSWSILLIVIMTVGIGSNLVFCSTELAGLNDWTGDLISLRREVPVLLNPSMARIDEELPFGAKVLMVGPAAVFHFGHPVLYNTVFNDDLLEQIANGHTPEEVRSELVRSGISHIYVDWSEIDRYRAPGNYGFTAFVTPELFAGLVKAGVLDPSTRPGAKQELYEVRSGLDRNIRRDSHGSVDGGDGRGGVHRAASGGSTRRAR
ncbi:ArnT family glycosyltransferase [Tundrisphaera lichenicola]|uniref:ArnT family glycosyltransferase n=1 Tax=Tundrisphaera lichenicola TaxID=2029860 RepID=UPI003EBA8328